MGFLNYTSFVLQPGLPPIMKTTLKLPLVAAMYCGLSSVGSAFTLDFVSVPTGTITPPALTVSVPGYGDVRFEPVGTASLVVDNRYATPPPGIQTSPSLNFDMGEAVTVTFLGPSGPVDPASVRVGTVDVNIGEAFITTSTVSPNVYTVQLLGSGNGAGLYNIKFEQVPEPSAALLGVIGASFLVIRRKR